MKQVSLFWYGPFQVVELAKDFKRPLAEFDLKYPFMKNWGFYLFFDKFGIVDIGQAAGRGRALRTRLKNETSTKSKFFEELKEIKIARETLQVKVAIPTEAKIDGELINPLDPYDVEFALICRSDPRINTHGIKRYEREDIEIINKGDFELLPERFVIRKGDKCQVSTA